MRSITRPHSSPSLWMAVILAGASILRVPCDDIRLSFVLVFEIGITAGLAVLLWRHNKWIALFLLMSIFSRMWPFYDRYSYVAFINILFGVLWYFLVVSTSDFRRVHFMFNAMCVIALANVVMLMLQQFNVDPIFTPVMGNDDPPVGLMSNKNMASALLAFTFPAFMRPRWKWLIPVIIGGLLMTKSTGGPIALAAGLVFYSLVRGKALLWLAMALCLVLGYVAFVDMPVFFNARLDSWMQAWGYYKQHWMLGSGLGHWKVVFKRFLLTGTMWWTTAHNEYLQMAFEMGAGFVILLAGYVQNAIRTFRPQALLPAVALVIIAANSMVNFGFHVATTAMIAVTWMALYDVQKADEQAG